MNVLCLNGVSQIFSDNLSNNLLYGVIDFFKWATLEAGGFANISGTISGVYGGSRNQLRPVNDARYSSGRVWEGFRSNWIWESGINAIHKPDIYINNTLQPTNSGYYIDYPNGRVIFNSGLNTRTNTITANFSYRTLDFKPINDNIIPDIFCGSYRTDSDFISTSGSRSQLSELKQQLPIIAVDVNPNKRYAPLQLGGGQWCYVDVIFYVLTENNSDANNILDMISHQNDKTIWLINRDEVKKSGNYPYSLTYRGDVVENPLQYPELVSTHQWRTASFSETRSYNYTNLPYNLRGGIVKTTFIIPMGNI